MISSKVRGIGGDCRIEGSECSQASPGAASLVSLTGYVLARSGRTDEARSVLGRLEETARTRFVPPYAMALIHAGLGDRAAVLDWLERAEQVRDVHLVFLPVDPKWDPFRDDTRFRSLLQRCGLSGVASASD